MHCPSGRLSRRRSLALVTAAAVSLPLAPTRARAQELPTIRIGQNVADTFGEGLYGVDGGIFRAAGLDVEVQTFPNGAAQAAACVGGAIDVGLGEATEIANGVVHGVGLAIFAGGGVYESAAPSTVLCVAANAPLRVPKDLEGQTIAVPALTALSCMAVKAWLVKNDVNLARVAFVELPTSAMVAALERGTVGAAHFGEPFLSAAAGSVRRFAAPYDAIGQRFLISDWFATRAWLTANGPLATRLTAAIYATARWVNANHDLTAPILSKYTKIDVDLIRKMRRVTFATSLESAMIQPVLDTATAYGGLPRHVAAAELLGVPKAS